MIQLILLVFSGLAIWLTQQPNRDWQKYACFPGLVAQPFWMYSSHTADQWGIFLLSAFYFYSFWIGFHRIWILRDETCN